MTLVPLRAEEVEQALKEKRIDAAAVIAVPGGKEATTVLKAVERATNRQLTVLPVAGGEALAQRIPALTTIEIPAGALGGRPSQPEEQLDAVGVSYRLVGRNDLDPSMVAELTEQLFELRPRLARIAPAANRIEAPESIMSATLPVHPGAIQYLERERLTFFERYGDYIYLVMFSMGGIGSAFAWLTQRFLRRRRELVDEVLDRLMCILSEARVARTAKQLDDLAVEVDNLVTHAVRYARNRTTGTRTMTALIMAIDSARAAIADRRRDVLREGGASGQPESAHKLIAAGSPAKRAAG